MRDYVDPMSLFGLSLKQRRVLEWAVAYLATAWLVLQVLDVLNEVWPISVLFQRAVHLSLAVGFPVVAVLGWFHGAPGKQGTSMPEVLLLTALALVAATALSLLPGIDPQGGWLVSSLAVVAMAALPTASLVAWRVRRPRAPPETTAGDPALMDFHRRVLLAPDTGTLRVIAAELEQVDESTVDAAELSRLRLVVSQAIDAEAGGPLILGGLGERRLSPEGPRGFRSAGLFALIVLSGTWLLAAGLVDQLSNTALATPLLSQSLVVIAAFSVGVAFIIARWVRQRSRAGRG